MGAEENFFELGGHSLLATQVISRVRAAFGVEVPLKALFEAPTVAGLAVRIEALRSTGALLAPPIVPVPRDGAPLPLSFAQQRLWVVDRIEPDSAAYNMPFPLRLRGALELPVLRASLDALVERHESLRTVFPEEGGRPVQVVHPAARVPLPMVDLRGLPEEARQPEAKRLSGAEAMRPFDLARGPLLRGTLVRLDEEDHVLLFTLHHIVGDGWSMQVLVREVSVLYAAFSQGEAPELPALPVQYADFAVWQREWLSGEVLQAQIDFWRERLEGAPPLLEVPTDRPRRAGQSPLAGNHPFTLSSELSQRLRELARREGATLFMTLLAGWQALLSKYSGQDDVVVGTPIAGRNRRETEGLIGFFVNTLALRARLAADPTWSGLLGQVREETLGAYDHQDLPFERLVEELGVERSLTHTPVFQTMFTLNLFDGESGEKLDLGELGPERFGGGEGVAKFDLDLVFSDGGEGLGAGLLYRRTLFEAATIARMVGHLQTMLEALAADPRQRLSELSLLNAAERVQLLEASGTAPLELPPTYVQEMISAQALRTPGAPAVVSGGEALTYGELESAANRLAHHLRLQGVAPETRVGICLERSLQMVVGVLGVLKAGGAYVPLEPSYPAERLAYMMEDAALSVLLTREGLLGSLPPHGARAVCLDRDAAEIARQSGTAPESGLQPENLAYVIYTSGSTGRPKGVEVVHGGVSNYLGWAAAAYAGEGHGAPVHSSLTFDLTVTSLLVPLARGEKVVLTDEAEGVEGLARALREEPGFTLVKLTPAHLGLLAEQLTEAEAAAAARTLVVGGEALPAEVAAYWRRVAPETALVNEYGPTETVVGCSVYRVPDESVRGTVPVGRPIAGTRLYVLGGEMQLVPAGMTGELYVGGAGVARGYLGRAGLTAEKFVPDAFGGQAGARLYRTGDRARWRMDGELEFLGRIDAQVKIRGFRIEPGEIEAVLLEHPGVGEAVVTVREDVPGDRRLVAYAVPRDGAGIPGTELRAYLRERLPEYLVPSAFVTLDALPLNANGKVDRRALPAPDRGSAVDAYAAPRTPAEEVLAGIWAEVLKTERVGAEDNFFELGGHSLLATQVISRVRQAFGVEVPLKALFEAPTVAGLAVRIEALRSAGTLLAPPLVPVVREGPLPLSFAQQRLWVVDRIEPGSPAYNMPSPLRLRGALELPVLRASLDALVERHESLRTVFPEEGGSPVQVVHPAAPVPLPMVDLRSLPEEARQPEARRLSGAEAMRPFDLAQGPLLRGTLVRLGEEDHVLLFNMHHIVSDGWSMQVLVREVSVFYGAFSQGEEPRLPELPVQYADFAVWQREWLSGEVLQAQIDFWRERLEGAPPLLEVPTDRPRRAGQSPLAANHPFTLSPELSQRLRELARREGATLFMTLLAGWQALLSKYSGQDDVVVGTPIAGRNRGETEGLIGFFVNTLALRARLGADPTWSGLLEQVREETLGAYDHQDLPFERLVEELGVERSLTHTPVFQTMFTLNLFGGESGEKLDLGELGPERFGGGESVAKFDLDLVFSDGGEVLGGGLLYRRTLFEAATIARMAGHLETVLEALAADPARHLSELSLLRGEERAQVLEAWNDTAAAYPRERCIHELFAEQAARTPDAPAVVLEDQALTYAELEREANRLAHHLRRLGVGPEVRVGLLVERSTDLLVALLGTLKAGGAYIPLDPVAPPERQRALLADAGAPVLLTQASLAARLEGYPGVVVRLDEDREIVAREPDDAPAAGVHPRNLAYVLYTSGSTGAPKGVLVEHRSVLNLFAALQEAVCSRRGAAAPPRVTLNGPVFFDTSVKQWVQLLGGATLCVVPEETRADARALVAYLRRHDVEVLDCTPSQLRVLLAEGLLEDGASLTDLLVAGEALERDLWATLAAAEGRRAWNLYGPTECTVDASIGEVRGERPTIGRPVANARLYVLDPAGQPTPYGVPGELFVGGEGVARGYLGQPALTAEKFVPDSFGSEAGGRLYRTGDRTRWLAAGELEYLGRMDQQLKVRGFRIEPGEIEAALLEHVTVREAAVVAREQRLVAYVVAAEGAEATASALREHLSSRLPEYMVPGGFVVLERLPLNRNGKLDRRALPAPEQGTGVDRYVAPRTPAEEVLAGIWAEVLRLEQVSALDNFFELGGHSLLATQVISRVREAFGVEVPLKALFEAPTVVGLAGRIEALRSTGAAPVLPMVPVERDGPLPLSFAQQRLWVVDRIDPGSAAYNMPYPLRLRGVLELPVLRASLDALVRRHESLRTTFSEEGGRPVQVVHPAAPVPLPMVDLRGLPEEARQPEAKRLSGAEAMRPFDLGQGPLLRGTLVRLGEEDHVLLFNMHHIVSDGWSMQVLVREVSALYAGEPLPELPVQYADFAVWQREWLSGEVLQAQIDFWRERLEGAPPLLEVPTDRPRRAGQSPLAASHPFTLSPELSQRLRELARREGATLFMTLLAGWQALLSKYSGQEDVVVGTPIAGRNRRETEGLIGFFVNTLALRARLAADSTWSGLLEQVREETLGAYDHQDLPFERLVEELGVERSLTHTPVFQAMFTLNLNGGKGGERLELGELGLEAFGGGESVAKFDLDLVFSDGGEALGGGLLYRRTLFEAATIARMAGHLETVLEALAADPARRLSELSLLRGAERVQLLEEWTNDTARPYPERCLHELFAEQAARTPEAAAIRFGGRSTTYAELERSANRVANHLRERGVAAETRVGLCMERTPQMLAAMLGILKAGGAYVPLDPAYPAERLEYMLADSGAAVVVSQASLAGRLPADLARVLLDEEAEGIATRPDTAPRSGVEPGNLAYVLYTSGSTGRPKGVQVEHRSASHIVHFLSEMIREEDRAAVLGSTSVSFDVSVAEIYGTLCWGGTLVLVENALELPSVAEEGVRVVVTVPSAAAELLRTGGIPESVRSFNLGGEALPATLARGLYALPHVERVLNLYGPTEDTTYSTWSEVERGAERVRIGRPVANTRAYVLDPHGNPVPVGVPGELWLGGAGTTRGYHARPGLTAEKFVPDPFASSPGARMYRTGDRILWRADGELEYFGRLDTQVKIRGFRIELGEIESTLLEQEAVLDGVVLVREDAPGERRLVAYVVPREGAELSTAELRASLGGRLPEYMVPSAFVMMERLPLNPNGKVDRRALPRPQSTAPERAQAYEAPRDGLEETLTALFEEVLGVTGVGLHDNFFELGGQSLLAVQIMSKLKRATGVRLPVAALFKAPTVERLAQEVRSGGGEMPLLFPLRFKGSRPPLFLVHPGGGDLIAYSGLVKQLDEDQPVYGLRSRGLEQGEKPNWTIEEMARDYLASIRQVRPSGPYRLGGWSMGGVIAFEMARQLEAAGEEVESLVLIDSQVPWLNEPESSVTGDDLRIVQAFARDLGLPADVLPALGPEERERGEVAYLRKTLETARSRGMMPEDLDLARMQHLYGIFRINLMALLKYRPESYGGRITLLRSGKRGVMDRLFGKKSYGWERVVRGRIEVRTVPGTHYSMLSEPHLEKVAREVERAIG